MQAGLSTAILQDQAEATRLSLAERITRVVWLDRLLAAFFVSLYIAFVAFGFGYHQDWRLHRGIEVLVHTSHIWLVLCACALLVSAATTGSLSLWLEGYAYCLLVIKWCTHVRVEDHFWILFFQRQCP